MMLFSILCVCLLSVTLPTVAADTATCSILQYGALTMFNGETVDVFIPCKYRLADFTCDGYNIKVTPGSSLDPGNRFSPDTVWVSITESNGEKYVGRSTSSWLKPNGRKWNTIEETDFSSVVVSFDESLESVVWRVDGIFNISFSKGGPQDGVIVNCMSTDMNFTSGIYPNSLCGVNDSSGTIAARNQELFGQYPISPERVVAVDILSTDISQSPACVNISDNFKACKETDKDQVYTVCAKIFTVPSLTGCLIENDKNLTVFDQCMSSVCGYDGSQGEFCEPFSNTVVAKCGQKLFDDIYKYQCGH